MGGVELGLRREQGGDLAGVARGVTGQPREKCLALRRVEIERPVQQRAESAEKQDRCAQATYFRPHTNLTDRLVSAVRR